MRQLFLFCLLASFSVPETLLAQYSYYGTDTLSSYNNSAPNWNINGTGSNSQNAGLTVTSQAGAAYISKGTAPDGTSQYEVKATVKLAGSGGTYVLYLEATPNALLGSTSAGSFYAVAVQNPTFANGGCTAAATLYKAVNGSVSQISSAAVPCADGIAYHAAIGNDHALHFYTNGVEYLNWTDPQPLTGNPGVGGYGMPSGNGVDLVQLGPCDRVAPSSIDSASVQTYATSTMVNLQTAGSSDGANGIGVEGYRWYRDNVEVATTQTPEWSDAGVTAGSSHTYAVQAEDFHGNLAPLTTFSVPVPANAAVDARQVGVRPTGSYWGGRGEQIDTRSGNLNFTYPLVNAISRGWSVPLSLSYNSQNWRLDSSGKAWQLGEDTGFGFGWKLQIGSLTPHYSSYYTLAFYQYSDAGGAAYRLDQNNNGVWTSRDSVYVTYDSNTQRLYFNSGMYWVLGCTSAGTEGDAGTMYPTLLEDTNGNQIAIQYQPGNGVTWTNSSARITQIDDVRPGTNPNGSPTLSFTYNSNTVPHLTGIGNYINSQDSFQFSYSGATALSAPFGSSGASFDTVEFLDSATNNATSLTDTFTYSAANTGELTQVTFPLGGHIRWDYGNAAYSQSTVREVADRYLLWDPTIGERTYNFSSTPSSSGNIPGSRTVTDTHAGAAKTWQFVQNPGTAFGLISTYTEGAAGSQTPLRATNYTWTQDPAGNNYIGRLQRVSDPGQSYAVTSQVDQTVDRYGNVTQSKLYDYSDLNTPAKTYNTTYLTSANGADYTALYIRNRVASTTLTDRNGTTTTLQTNTYDQYPTGIAATGNIQMQDAADYGPSFTARGNLYDSATPWTGWHSHYDQTGTAIWTGNDVNPNHYTSLVTSPQTNYAVPDMVTTGNSWNTALTWSQSLQTTSRTGPNGDNASIRYDQSNRPSNVSSPYGAQTLYQYSTAAPQIVATTNSHWVKTYLDGLGRVAQVQKGDTSSTKSSLEMIYDACGCNPVGKVYQRSLPHTPGATAVWNVYTYDALGRMLTSVRPDGHSTTTYSYAGNTVTITDPAGKWKKITRDAFGQIAQVQEPSPNPATEPNHNTTYAYDVFGHLVQVTMPRTVHGQVVTQTRTWTYDPQTLRLLSKSSPEAGTVTYTYNPDNTLATVTDAKGQRKVYSYDTYGRITQIARGAVANGTFTEDPTQRTTYAYDGANGGYSSATVSRVSQIAYAGPHGMSFTEMYSYHNAGAVTGKRLNIAGGSLGSAAVNLNAAYTYDNEGNPTSIQYPDSQWNSDNTVTGGPTYSYTYDSMERLTGMTDSINTTWVSNASYGAANQLLKLNATSFTETRAYNANLELTELTSGANVHYRYNYAATQDNGQIQSQTDVLSGEVISYQYDSLQRLATASGQGDPTGAWSQAYGYDGFGNLTQKTATNAPALSVAVDPTTNRLQTNAAYDANGNMTTYASDQYSYDLQNRMTQANPASGGTVLYGYDSTNHRIYKGAVSGTAYSAEEIYFYGVEGHKYGTWQINPSSGVLLKASVTKQWFGNRLVSPQDRLDSRGKYYPYGEERTGINPPNPPNDQEKFASYTRDSATGLDYADQRYYDNLIGRFTKPDPFGGSANPISPQSWNRYAYVGGDPANANDPEGLCDFAAAGVTMAASNSPDFANFTANDITAYPFSAGATGPSGGGLLGGIIGVAEQTYGPTSNTTAAIAGLVNAAETPGPINVFAFSGGAGTFTAAINFLSNNGRADIAQRINNITYVSPGANGALYYNSNTIVLQGGLDIYDYAAMIATLVNPSVPVLSASECGHDFGCIAQHFSSLLSSREGTPCPVPLIINQGDYSNPYDAALPAFTNPAYSPGVSDFSPFYGPTQISSGGKEDVTSTFLPY